MENKGPVKMENLSGAIMGAASDREERFHRLSSSTNMLVFASCRPVLAGLQQLLDTLCVIRPGRYFVVYLDDSLEGLAVEPSARCYGLSKTESLCSEVIMIGTPARLIAAVPSVVFGHVLTGNPLEILLRDPCCPLDVVEPYLTFAEKIYLESSQFAERASFLQLLNDGRVKIVDLDWICLAVWRRQTAKVLGSNPYSRRWQHLKRVEIKGSEKKLQRFLLAGWLADRYNLSKAKEASNGALFLKSEGQHQIELVLNSADDQVGVKSMRFDFEESQPASVDFVRRGKVLEVRAEGQEQQLAQELFDDESLDGVMRRYFETGETIRGYMASLEKALMISAAYKTPKGLAGL